MKEKLKTASRLHCESRAASKATTNATAPNALSSAANVVPSNDPCYFLALPAELRLNIYRFLLLEPQSASLNPKHWTKIYESIESLTEYHLHADKSTHLSPSSRFKTELLQRYELSKQLCAHPPQRTPAVLQTNSQIYNEAFSVLYSGLQMVVRPRDALTKYSPAAVKGSRHVWRHHHHPSDDLERKNANGIQNFGKPGSGGRMEPHVFTRFQRIRYEADFNYCDGHASPEIYMYVHKDHHISDVDETHAITYFKDATACRPPAALIIQEFVDLLLDSPLINLLEVALSVEIEANYIPIHHIGDDGTFSLTKYSELQEVVNKRAYELFLESGALEPLKKLTNVKCFRFDLALVSYLPQRKLFQPSQKHLGIINDLKTAIERNFGQAGS